MKILIRSNIVRRARIFPRDLSSCFNGQWAFFTTRPFRYPNGHGSLGWESRSWSQMNTWGVTHEDYAVFGIAGRSGDVILRRVIGGLSL